MEWWQVIVLGVLQGVTEFLPISSSGHLVLVQQFFQLTREDAKAAMFFDGMLHLGTMLAVLWYFRRHDPQFGPSIALSHEYLAIQKTDSNQQTESSQCAVDVHQGNSMPQSPTMDYVLSWKVWLWLLGWASLPAALAVVFFSRQIRDSFVSVPMVAADMLVLGVLLWLTDRLPTGKIALAELRWYHALLIGVGQALSAVFRGLSRSGMTVSVALLLGIERNAAVRFSFAMSLVANLGLAFLGSLHAGLDATSAGWLTAEFLAKTLLAMVLSGVVAYATLEPLLQLVRSCRLRWFAYYLWLVGGLTWLYYAGRSP